MILFMNLLFGFSTYLIKSWISPGCSYNFQAVYVQQEKTQYLLYYSNIWSTHFQKQKEKKTLFIIIISHYFSRLYLFIFGWKLVITETSSYHKAHDQNAMRLVIIQIIKQGQLKSCHSCSIIKAVLKNSQYLQGNICVKVSF